MSGRSAICLVIDRLPAHLIGAYGNTWIHTPAFDSLAADSLLCEFATIDSPRLDRLYRSYLLGRHAAYPEQTAHSAGGPENLLARLRERSVRSLLVTDDPEVARLPFNQEFGDRIELPESAEPATADSVEETGLGRFFATAAEALASQRRDSPALLWLHTRGLGLPWDAPYDLRTQYAAEDDPAPPESAEVPNFWLAEDHDPDERLGIAQSCAGQATALDICLGALLDALDESPQHRETLLIVLGARGFPLGEHLRVGPCDDALYGELVHVPLLVRLPAAHRVPLRSTALIQPADLYSTLLAWCAGEEPAGAETGLLRAALGTSMPARDRAVAVGPDGQWSIRTPAWYLRQSVSDAGPRRELFVKPDDRWEVNDVARRCDDVVEQLAAAGEEFLQAAAADTPPPAAPLADVLLHGLG